jgi:hypothetical protein
MSAILGPGSYITSDQAHYAISSASPNGFANPDELVEGGQLLVIRAAATPAVPVLPSRWWLALFATLVAGTGMLFVRRPRFAR